MGQITALRLAQIPLLGACRCSLYIESTLAIMDASRSVTRNVKLLVL